MKNKTKSGPSSPGLKNGPKRTGRGVPGRNGFGPRSPGIVPAFSVLDPTAETSGLPAVNPRVDYLGELNVFFV